MEALLFIAFLRPKFTGISPIYINKMVRYIALSLLLILTYNQSHGQIWDSKNIEFALPSQGWRIRPANEKTAWTFGFTITEDPFDAWAFTDSEFTCQRTIDGGNTWEEITFKTLDPGSGFICDIQGLSDKIAFLSYYSYSEGPLLYMTKDGGLNWTTTDAGMGSFLNWVHFYDVNNGLAFGDPGEDGFFEISHTTNGGATWTLIESDHSIESAYDNEFGVYGDFVISGNYVFTRSDYDRIFYSDDKGKSWAEVGTPVPPSSSALWGLACNDQAEVIAAYNTEDTDAFYVYKRNLTNGEWANITPADSNGYVTGMAAIPGTQTILINKHFDFADDQSFVTLASTDGGNTWLEVSKNQGYRTGFTQFLNASVGYACEIPGDFDNPTDNVFVYNGSPLTGLLTQQTLTAELTLFPNPAVNELYVELKDDNICDYYIYLHDLKGKLIGKKIVNMTKGFHEKINVSSLPSGEYMVTVCNATGFKTMRFVK